MKTSTVRKTDDDRSILHEYVVCLVIQRYLSEGPKERKKSNHNGFTSSLISGDKREKVVFIDFERIFIEDEDPIPIMYVCIFVANSIAT